MEDAFECPICSSQFEGSIFQCKNGHVVCGTCLAGIEGSCPSCREPVGDIRCRAMENAIASMALSGSFMNQECPFEKCTYYGPLLYEHIQGAHHRFVDHEVSLFGSAWRVKLDLTKPFEVLLDPVGRRVFLLLNGGGVESGRSLSVVCLAPRPKSMEYKLEVGRAGEVGALYLSATGSVPCMRSWSAGQYPADGFLFVPNTYYCGSLDREVVKVHVNHVHALDRLARLVRRDPVMFAFLVVFAFFVAAIAIMAVIETSN